MILINIQTNEGVATKTCINNYSNTSKWGKSSFLFTFNDFRCLVYYPIFGMLADTGRFFANFFVMGSYGVWLKDNLSCIDYIQKIQYLISTGLTIQ